MMRMTQELVKNAAILIQYKTFHEQESKMELSIKDTLAKSVIIPGNKTEEKYNENG